MPNVFQKLNEKQLAKHPMQDKGIEKKVLQQANTFSTFGRVVELYGLNAFQAALEIVGAGSNSQEAMEEPKERPELMTDWRKPVPNLPQAPKEGILGRFRPNSDSHR